MLVNGEMRGTVMLVTVNVERLDKSNSGGFKEGLKPIVARHKRIVIDMSSVLFIDSSGLGAVLSALRQANSLSGDVRLANLTTPVRVVVELTRMHRIFRVFESEDAAVRSYEVSPSPVRTARTLETTDGEGPELEEVAS